MGLLADLSISTEAVVVIGVLLSALTGALTLLYKQLTATQMDQVSELKSQRDSYKEMAAEAMSALEAKVNELRAAAGKAPFEPMAAVVPEHSSPVTESQQQTADLQTMRARLTAAVMELGLPAREATVDAAVKV